MNDRFTNEYCEHGKYEWETAAQGDDSPSELYEAIQARNNTIAEQQATIDKLVEALEEIRDNARSLLPCDVFGYPSQEYFLTEKLNRIAGSANRTIKEVCDE